MALVELMMLFAAIKAKDFQQKPTVRNMTEWCNATQVIDDPYTMQVDKWKRVKRTMGRRMAA